MFSTSLIIATLRQFSQWLSPLFFWGSSNLIVNESSRSYCKRVERQSETQIYWLMWWPSSVVWGILFKAINSQACTDICSLSINFEGRPHHYVPWHADVSITILSLEIGTLCVIVFTSMTIVSIADEDPRVVHASVVLHSALNDRCCPDFCLCGLVCPTRICPFVCKAATPLTLICEYKNHW